MFVNKLLKRKVVVKSLSLILAVWSVSSLAQNLGSLFPAQDEFLPEAEAYVVSALASEDKISFRWRIADGYYLYKHQFGLKLNTPEGASALPFTVPEGIIKFDKVFNKDFEVYYGEVELTTPRIDIPAGSELLLLSQGCADAGLCYSPRTQYFVMEDGILLEQNASTVTLAQTSTPAPGSSSPAIASGTSTPNTATASESGLLSILIGAIIGGMILNLMPCVFPVLSLKALTLASGSQAEHRINGWAYTAGVVLSFAGVAGILIAAKSAGTVLGWGFQLQEPAFIAGLIYLFFLLAMNLFGMFEIGTSWMGLGQSLTQGNGVTPSFFTGVLAAVVASPCTAPFMATAIGFTLTQGPVTTIIVFVALGFGMALPYLLLSHSHTLASRLPSPGPWMDVFKQFLAFPLLFTCVWLLVVLGNQTSAYASALVVGGTIALAMALWLKNHTPRSHFKWLVRLFAVGLAVMALKLAVQIERYAEPDQSGWQTYSSDRLTELRSAGFPVFIDLTADWCITCKINERVALTDEVMLYAEEKDIVMMRGDWTKSDPEITSLLHQFGRNGVPLYLMYPEDSMDKPEILPQILTTDLVLEAMKRAVADEN